MQHMATVTLCANTKICVHLRIVFIRTTAKPPPPPHPHPHPRQTITKLIDTDNYAVIRNVTLVISDPQVRGS